MNNMIGVGTDKPRDTNLTHCSPTVLLGRDISAAPLECSRVGAASVTPKCGYCHQPDAVWAGADLVRGKRGMRPGPGVEYHCMIAFYGAQ